MRVALLLEYDGTAYAGWQVQAGHDSVQARIEQALNRLFGTPIRLAAAGRTDAGVHALGQVAAFDAPRHWETAELQRALNALLPPDIAVRQAREVAASFNPRRDAQVRIYEYRIRNRPLRSAFGYRYAWHLREPLDLELMGAAAREFLGEHDFAAFRTLGTQERSTVRRIYQSEWRGRDDLVYRVEGSSFLRRMVRTMVAAMVEVGRHRQPVASIRALLREGERAQAPAAAPSCGLFLVGVRYPLRAGLDCAPPWS
jgi:tRNA pseudouridine38-40 synthase